MTAGLINVMASNQRLIRQVERDLFNESHTVWVSIYSKFCKRHSEFNKLRLMQFKYKGVHYHLLDDVPQRAGVLPLDASLVDEFEAVYSMFVAEVVNEKRILKNMLAHAIKIAKYSEDLIKLLPEVMHPAVIESGFFQLDSKAEMHEEELHQFKELYGQYDDLFTSRKVIGAFMQ